MKSHISIRFLVLLAYAACGMLVLVLAAHGHTTTSSNRVEFAVELTQKASVPNLVTTVYLKNRLYDTIFEVFVFSVAVTGVWLYMRKVEITEEITFISEIPAVISGRIAAAFSVLIGVHLALWGHLSPGGGFAAGVAGGTGLVLVAITGDLERTWKHYESLKMNVLEKYVLLLILVISVVVFLGYDLPTGKFGHLFSGGSIPILNLLIFFKVTTGTWLISYVFIKHRGIL